MMILVTGATGNLGSATIKHLIQKTNIINVVALARTPDKALPLQLKGITVKIGDYHHYDSLLKAFRGIEKVLLIFKSESF